MENLKAAIFGHPEPTPDWSEPLPYLLEVPSAFASSSSLRRFERETLRPLLEARPNDGFLQAVAVRLVEVFAYRAALPPALHFWRVDLVRCCGCGRCFFVADEGGAASCFVCAGTAFAPVARSAIPVGVTLSAIQPEAVKIPA